MTTTEDRLATALRTGATRFAATPDLQATLSRSRRIRRRRRGVSAVAAVAVAALSVSAVRAGAGPAPDQTGAGQHAFSPIAASPLSLRIWSSQVSLGTDVFVWGGERTTVSYKAPEGSHCCAAPGRPASGLPLADGAIYSAQTDSWRELPPTHAAARVGAPAALTPDGVLVVGGSDAEDPLHPDLRSGVLYNVDNGWWTAVPDAPFCPNLAVPQGLLVYAYGTTCDQDGTPAFGWYDLDHKRWHVGPLPNKDTRQLLPYQGSVVALGRQGETVLLSPQRDSWVTLDPLPSADNTGVAPAGSDVVTDFVTAWDATTLYAVGQVDFGRKGTAVFAMSGNGWVEVGRLPLGGSSPKVQPPARFGAQASVQDGLLVWHADHGVSWFDPATFQGGFVATRSGGPVNAVTPTPLVPVGNGRFLWWGGHTGETDPRTHRPLSPGTIVTLP